MKRVRGVRQLNDDELPDTSASDKIFYYVEWEDSDSSEDSSKLDLVPSKKVREKAPQHIIEYYTSIIRWAPPPSSSPGPIRRRRSRVETKTKRRDSPSVTPVRHTLDTTGELKSI